MTTYDKILNERERCDLECIINGSFHPLKTYMTKNEYEGCLKDMYINPDTIFPIPIVLMVYNNLDKDTKVIIKSDTGVIFAELTIAECWKPDLQNEYRSVFGTEDDNHPYIKYMEDIKNNNKQVYYVSGELNIKNINFHSIYNTYRKTPSELKEAGPWIGFQTRNPLHRSHIELIKRASNMANAKILLHPVEGVTQECDIPFSTRMHCYKEILPKLGNNTELSILPLSMRMAGPKEAVWHAIIRKNYGCSHFIVGRDHAGPSYRKKDGSTFYGPYDAQKLAKSVEDKIGIKIIESEELVYCEDINDYKPISESNNNIVKQISGTELRKKLANKEDIPEWFSYAPVINILKEYYNKTIGICFYFVGLSGSGKSTLAEHVKARIEEEYPNRAVTLLDADIIRTHLSKGLGFSKEDRSANVRRIGYVASEIVKHGGIVIVANIAPYEEDRKFNRELISQQGIYKEFYVATPIEICECRDVKGLYKLARQGKIKQFTGIDDPFEEPENSLCIPNFDKDYVCSIVSKYCLNVIENKNVSNQLFPKDNKILISGTGRCGTTFLIKLFSFCNLDTGFTRDTYSKYIYENCNSGMEKQITAKETIIKNPNFIRDINLVFNSVNIEYMIIPIRDFEESAKSRMSHGYKLAGGLVWDATDVDSQIAKYNEYMTKYNEYMKKYNINTIFLDFYKMVNDKEYLYEQLLPILLKFNVSKELYDESYDLASSTSKPKNKTTQT